MILVLFLQGCAVLGNRHVAAGCQVADGMTTYVALKKGAVELNPLFSSASPGAILLIKLVMAYAVWKIFDPESREQEPGDEFVAGVVTVLGCVPAINNVNVIRKLP